jgi:O-antigen/teichoic acid export membrane protein
VSIKRNIISNLLGGLWVTGLTLVITPLQVNLLGIEAYGLIGFIATLQLVFAVFDLGLSSTLTREIATDQSANLMHSVELIRTASTVYWSFAAVVGTALACSAGFIATQWLTSSAMSAIQLEHSLYAMTVYLAARWPVSMYAGILTGLQRLDVLNAVKVCIATLRLVGGIVVLLIWHDLQVFLWWTAFSAIIEVFVHLMACRRVFPSMPLRFGLSLQVVKSVWAFSLSMSALSVLALLISQLDRLVVSKVLPLAELGNYTLAYTTAAVCSLGIAAVSSAVLPSFAAAHGRGSINALSVRYDHADRVILFVVGFLVFPMVFFGDLILRVWIGPAAAEGAAGPLALIAMGFWCSGALSNAYSLAVASGNPGLPLRLSAISALPYAAVLYWLTRHHGIEGAALAWLGLNVVYVIVLVPAVHRNVLKKSMRGWLVGMAMPFSLLGIGAFAGSKLLSSHVSAAFESAVPRVASGAPIEWAALGSAILLYAAIGYLLLGNEIRSVVWSTLRLRTHTP